MRIFRSRSPSGTDEPRAPGPAQDEAHAPPEGAGSTPANEGPAEDQPHKRKRSRSRKRRGERRAEGEAPEGDESPEGRSDTQPVQAAGQDGPDQGKSRSKRRRERRAEAKARSRNGEAQPDLPFAGARDAEGGPERPAPRPPRPAPPRQAQGGAPSRPDRPDRPERAHGAGRERPPRPDSADRRPRGEDRHDRPARFDRERQERKPFEGSGRQDRPRKGGPRADRPWVEREGDFRRGNEGGRPPSFHGLPPGLAEAGDIELPERYGQGGSSRKPAPVSRVLETLAPSAESLAVLGRLEAALDEAAPLHPKHRAALRGDIRQLWEELTADKEYRSAEYLGTPAALSAYLRYFLPWNVYRLSSIFSNADFCLPDNAVVVDIGSGPLTLPIALYASRPELREVPLTIYCMDRVERVLEAGKTVFETLCMRSGGALPPWRIELVKDSFGAKLPERAHLLASANVFNEFFWKDRRPLGERALETARTLLSYLREGGSLFLMEPGDPRSGAFVTALRAALAAEGAAPLGPCPHALSCPLPGIFRHLLPPEETRVVKGDPNAAPSRFVLPPVVMPKKRDKFPWCHFGIDTESAPDWLRAVSEEAGLPKERAVLSYLWAARGAAPRPFAGLPESTGHSEKERRARAGKGILVRVISDPFSLPDGATGQYACSNLGYTLIRRPRGEEAFESGDLLEVAAQPMQRNDEKSGAIILPS